MCGFGGSCNSNVTFSPLFFMEWRVCNAAASGSAIICTGYIPAFFAAYDMYSENPFNKLSKARWGLNRTRSVRSFALSDQTAGTVSINFLW